MVMAAIYSHANANIIECVSSGLGPSYGAMHYGTINQRCERQLKTYKDQVNTYSTVVVARVENRCC